VTEFGRRNRLEDPALFIKKIKEESIPYSQVKKISVEDRIVVGEFVDVDKEEFSQKYYNLTKKVD